MTTISVVKLDFKGLRVADVAQLHPVVVSFVFGDLFLGHALILEGFDLLLCLGSCQR